MPVVVTPPVPFVSLVEAKEHLRVDTDDENDLIDALIAAACAHIDGPGGWLGRAIGDQTLQLYADEFPTSGEPLWLPYPPIATVDSVLYTDSNGAEQTLDSATYRILGAGSDKTGLDLAYGLSWPTIRAQRDALSIIYTAGYGDDIPAPIKAAALLMVGDLFENRETVVIGTISAAIQMSTTVERLLAPYRIF